jgi:hypothetical protein
VLVLCEGLESKNGGGRSDKLSGSVEVGGFDGTGVSGTGDAATGVPGADDDI